MKRWSVRECPDCKQLSASGRLMCEFCAGWLGETFHVQRVSAPDENTAGLVSHAHGDTARMAALLAAPRTGSTRAIVLDFIEATGALGATRDEIAEQLAMSANTVRPRVRELIQGGHVVVSPRLQRRTPAGLWAEVLLAVRFNEP